MVNLVGADLTDADLQGVPWLLIVDLMKQNAIFIDVQYG